MHKALSLVHVQWRRVLAVISTLSVPSLLTTAEIIPAWNMVHVYRNKTATNAIAHHDMQGRIAKLILDRHVLHNHASMEEYVWKIYEAISSAIAHQNMLEDIVKLKLACIHFVKRTLAWIMEPVVFLPAEKTSNATASWASPEVAVKLI